MKYCIGYHLHRSGYNKNGNPYNIYVRVIICNVLSTIHTVAHQIFYSENKDKDFNIES